MTVQKDICRAPAGALQISFVDVTDWVKNQGYDSDAVLRVDIGVLNSATAKITGTAIPSLFSLMDSLDDFENSYKDFGTFK